MTERTIFDLYRHDARSARPDHYVMFAPGGTRALSTDEFFATTVALADGLAGLGVRRGDRVLLLSDNRPEWHIADLAVLSLRAVDVPVYGTLTPEQIAYQARDSGATAAVVDTPAQMDKLLAIRDACPELRHLVQLDGRAEHGVTPFAELVASGRGGAAGDRFWERAARAREDDLATVIYTSGTTGEPKGVMLTHRNLVANVLAAAPRVPVGETDLALEFLPLCHVLERMLGYVYMWRATRKAYCSVYHVGELIASIRPTVFAGVPRFYEKVQDKVVAATSASPAKAAAFRWALGVGRDVALRRIGGRRVDAVLAAQHRFADRAVLAKVRAALGGRVRYCISGGAALPLHVAEFFHAVGVPIMEGYGLTETSPVIAVNGPAPGWLRLGTVGRPLDNLELRFAPDGELLVRGPSVTSGYWKRPEQTAEVIDEDGFFHTGDIADLDDGSFLLITDRKKDLLVTAGGKNIAPQPIEAELKRSPLVDNGVVVGDGRPFVVALLSPNVDELARWASRNAVRGATVAELTAQPEVVNAYGEIVESVNAGLASYEQIKRFRVLPEMLSLESGHLTPTLKVKRRVVEGQFATLIEEMYRERAGK